MIDLRLIDGESEACTVVAMRSTRSNEQPRGNEGRLDGVVQHQRACRGERKMGANQKQEECGSIGNVRGRGLRGLRKTRNDKNTAYHHNHVSACKREKKLLL